MKCGEPSRRRDLLICSIPRRKFGSTSSIFDAKTNDITYYYASRLPREPPEGVNDYHFHPTEPRSFRLGLLYTF